MDTKADSTDILTAPTHEAIRALLKEIEINCPCGARPESLDTHPHVGSCPVAKALGLVAALPQWRPIATAPQQRPVWLSLRNGQGNRRTVKAVFFPAGTLDMDDNVPDDAVDEEGHNAEAGWYEDAESFEPAYMPLIGTPTHWMPLPAPPEAK